MSVNPDSIGFEFVRNLEVDARQIFEWRNDPETRQNSFHMEEKIWDDFYGKEFPAYFRYPDLPPLFILFDNHWAGFISLKPVENPISLLRKTCEVSINIAPKFRGKGIGKAALIALQDWVHFAGYDDIYAEVKIENEASHTLFLSANFHKLNDSYKYIEDIDKSYAISRYICHVTPFHPEHPKPVFIIAEAGVNWRMGSPKKDMAMAKILIDAAAKAGADAIKFQTFHPETIYVPNAGQSDYLAESGLVEDIQSIFKENAMPYEMIGELAFYCKQKGIEFMSTPFSEEDFLAVDLYVSRHKIASYEISHIRLLELAGRSGKPLILSTGASNEDDIDWAVETYFNNGGSELTLLQCTAHYPAENSSMNLQVIPWLKKRFGVDAGLSDHSRNPIWAPVAAVALGANVIEKHFTVSNALPGPDHAFAITVDELEEMVKAIRSCEKMRGSGIKRVQEAEVELRLFARRGIQAIKNIAPGEVLSEGVNIAILRPGKQLLGMHPKYMNAVEGKISKRFIPLGKGIHRADWEEPVHSLNHFDPKKLKVVLIDMDGTLANSLPALYHAYRRFLEDFGHKGNKEEFMSLIGPSLPEVLDKLISKYKITHLPEDLVLAYQNLLIKSYAEEIPLHNGALECLHFIKRELGLKLGLVTSASATLSNTFLKAHDLQKWFDCTIAHMPGMKGKPHPDLYLKALSLFGVEPDEALVVEDSDGGVQAGVAAGIYTVRLRHGERGERGEGEGVELGGWHELVKVLRSWYRGERGNRHLG